MQGVMKDAVFLLSSPGDGKDGRLACRQDILGAAHRLELALEVRPGAGVRAFEQQDRRLARDLVQKGRGGLAVVIGQGKRRNAVTAFLSC